MEAGTLSAATSGRDAGKPCRFSRDRLYLNVGIGLRIAGGENRPRTVRVMGWIVARSGVRVVDAVRPRQGRREATSIQSARPVNC
jgi:hypothetical protein